MRIPHIAGTWYPGDSGELNRLFNAWKSSAPALPHPAVILVPHAGYAYSGELAANVYSRLTPEDYEQVIILAPSHHAIMPGKVSVEGADDVMTPLGPVTFSKPLHDALRSLPSSVHIPAAHAEEHSIDIQLPMIRRFLPDCRLGALLVGHWTCTTDVGRKQLRAFAAAFKKLLTPKTLLVISSDFTHYGTGFGYVPFKDHIADNIAGLDQTLFRAFASNSNKQFADTLNLTKATVCGASAMHLVLAALPEKAVFTQLAYDTSGRMTRDWSHCVSYLTAMIQADWSQPMKGTPPADGASMLSAQAGRALVDMAKQTLRHAVAGSPAPEILSLPKEIASELERPSGAFVTLNKQGKLRGCIGEILPNRPLLKVVMDRTVSAALEDPRFPPVQPEELNNIDVEVSVLTPPYPVASLKDIVIGTHGVILQKEGHTAVFLPQVAPEQGWDLPTMLTHLALKAGLAPDAWKTGATFHVFTAQILH